MIRGKEIDTTFDIKFGQSGDGLVLDITEVTSGVKVLRIPFTLEQAAQALMSNQVTYVDGTMWISDKYGMKSMTRKISLNTEDHFMGGSDWSKILDQAERDVKSSYPGWELCKESYNRNNSSIRDDDQCMYRFTIRKWFVAGPGD
jgi:hypothetical protein